ncbi:unnamed protein product [Angiostrongylus costaricensis]|uniref:NR LBD domain-containing protein n=1 Tax=Angiostrongylus costaricensis TaxID=334426 RepID=A0A0R3PA61_ANGCS|nr:unnamed protein product [Angiostrongylus costaricensis]
MPSPCAVCEMPSNGLHFGVSCCRACAAFFRRTLSLRLKYKCRFSGTCVVIENSVMQADYDEYEWNSKSHLPSSICSSESHSSCSPTQSVRRIPATVPNGNNPSPIAVYCSNATSYDFHSNAQMVLKAKIDALFDMEYNVNVFPYTIVPLSVSQQAMIAYANHSQHWPDSFQGKTSEVNIIDVEHILRDTYVEIEYFAQFAMSLQSFSQLPKDQKWLLFRNFWPGFFQLDRNFHTCKLLGYDINDERTVCFDGTVVNLKGHVTRLDMISDLNEEQVRKVMKPSNDLYRELVTYPFKRLRPNEFELLYMVISCMWNVRNIPNVAKETIDIAEQVKSRLAEDVHNYYTYELRMPNYASRLHKMSFIISAVDKLKERRKEDKELSRMFNIFKQDIFITGIV